ncbi:hypothetical protein G5V58_17170 [Nocardioides anomalus]|uniref:Uncharacterized protein n=1 Tax=Nocardioides anomalus TaxID=2712223 RepID=A0A6G6WGI7_9ACTN|nr:hypothetical protein [Nocardioides anomalus]QIG44273.1 hypothetical protein G5V58_17170 [Nocardioides anomalus]
MTGWEPADGWVLASIGVFQRPCTLTELVAAGDWMNHAVLTEPEVSGALGRLVGSGLARVYEDWTLELTDEGASLFSAEVRSIQTQLDLIEDGLAGRAPEPARVRLPDGAFAAAVAAYLEHREG